MDFCLLRREAGLTISDCAKLFLVHPRTVKNWEVKNKPPRAVFLYLSVLTGQLDHMGSDWKGFRFFNDHLLSPEGDHLYAWEVRAIRYLFLAAGVNRAGVSGSLKAAGLKKPGGRVVPYWYDGMDGTRPTQKTNIQKHQLEKASN